MQENFSFELLTDPKKFFEDMLKRLVIFVIKIIVFGIIFYVSMKKTGLIDNSSMINYAKYFIVASIVMYCVSMANMIYDRWSAGTKLEQIAFKKLFKASLFVPVFVIIHIILLIICSYLVDTPELGIIVYLISWTSIGIVIGTGIAYTITYDGANYLANR